MPPMMLTYGQQTYNRELKSVFDIQDDISRAIVDAMRIELFGTERGRYYPSLYGEYRSL